MAEGGGTNSSKLPEKLLEDIKLMLDKKDSYTISEFGKDYFITYKTYVQPSRFGLKCWADIFDHPDVKAFCEVVDGIIRKTGNGAGGFVRNPLNPAGGIDKVIQAPVSGTGSSKRSAVQGISNDVTKRSKPEELMQVDVKSITDTDITDRTHVTILPQNKVKLDRERHKIEWIPREPFSPVLTFNNLMLERIMMYEEPQTHIDCTYCERPVLEKLMSVKDTIKLIGMKKFTQIRNDYNKFEFSNGGIFQHGAAIIMANIDALMEFSLSNPKGPDGTSLVQGNELLYFVDAYGGPGGGAEYFLWKKKWQAKGFGIAPRATEADYNLKQAEHFPRESFEPYYGGDTGLDGDGNILKPFNVSKFTQFVRQSTGERGAHIMIATASDQNDYIDEDQREVRVKYTLLSEFLIALQVLRPHGHFVCRIYDMYTAFTVGLIYLMFKTFEQVAVFKPESSLPASSEKYIICKWKKDSGQVREIINYLQECHKVDWISRRSSGKGKRDSPIDISDLISRDRIRDSFRFCSYIQNMNRTLGLRQYDETMNLSKKINYNQAKNYIVNRLEDIQSRLLHMWGVPDKTRVKPKYASASTPLIRANKLVTPYNFDFFDETERIGEEVMTRETITQIVKHNEWSFMPVGKDRGFYLCLGGNQVYKFGGAKWSLISEKVELMNNTLVYGDFVDELKLDGATSTISVGFHIIDALVLGGKDIRNFPCGERFDLIFKYAKSMTKESRADLVTIRLKEHYEPKSMEKFLRRVSKGERVSRIGGGESSLLIPVDSSFSGSKLKYRPAGLLFMKVYKDNFAPADLRYCMQNRLFWDWNVAQDEIDLDIPENVADLLAKNAAGGGDEKMSDNLSGMDLLRHFNNPPAPQ